MTGAIRVQCADQWRDIVAMPDDRAADLIRQDGIDILVDLAGHTAQHRLLLMARKPAPIQMTYLGYPGTTGLAAIDYRLTDSVADPPGLTDSHNSETLLRLPRTNWCFSPIVDAPPVTPCPPPSFVGNEAFASAPSTTSRKSPQPCSKPGQSCFARCRTRG